MKSFKFIAIIGLCFAIKLLVFKPFVITSNSMNSILKQGDYVIVNKWQNSILGHHFHPKQGEIIAFHYPLDQSSIKDKIVYIKRCIGMPGDTLSIYEGKTYKTEQSIQFDYVIKDPNSIINRNLLEKIDVNNAGKTNNNNWLLSLNDEQINFLKDIDNQFRFKKLLQHKDKFDLTTFPSDTLRKWNRDFYGPIYVPKAGEKITINLKNISLYRKIIEIYENHKLEVYQNKIYIDDELSSSYTFGQNYYFMMGDNRHHSKDSRHWGFVPKDHLIGTCAMVIFNLEDFTIKRLFKPLN